MSFASQRMRDAVGVYVSSSQGESLVTITAYGISIAGISLGLHPELMLAGLWGAWWHLMSAPPMSWTRRLSMAATASMVAAYFTPAITSVASRVEENYPIMESLRYPIAVAIGYLAHRVIGPMMERVSRKKIEDMTK